MIIVPSVISVTSAHEESLYLVTEKRIIEAATLCIKEEYCSGDIIYLKELYEYDYLSDEYDPVTKEYYSEESYVIYNEDEAKFVSV